MYLQEIIEVALRLVFLWMVISLTAMSLQEWVANVLEWRAKYLEKALRVKPRACPPTIPARKFAAVLYDLVYASRNRGFPLSLNQCQGK